MLKTLESAFGTGKLSHLRGRVFPRNEKPSRISLQSALLWSLLSVIIIAVSFRLDEPMSQLLTLGKTSAWIPMAQIASKTGEGWVVAVVGILCTLFLFWRRRFRGSEAAFLIGLAGLLTGATATILRSLLGRTRPTSGEVQGFYGVWHDSHFLVGKYEFGAFPSGHAATVIGVAAAAWLIDRRLGLLASVYALIVSWSRVALGCHHFSDIVAAGIVGIIGAQVILSRLGPGLHAIADLLRSKRGCSDASTHDGRG